MRPNLPRYNRRTVCGQDVRGSRGSQLLCPACVHLSLGVGVWRWLECAPQVVIDAWNIMRHKRVAYSTSTIIECGHVTMCALQMWLRYLTQYDVREGEDPPSAATLQSSGLCAGVCRPLAQPRALYSSSESSSASRSHATNGARAARSTAPGVPTAAGRPCHASMASSARRSAS